MFQVVNEAAKNAGSDPVRFEGFDNHTEALGDFLISIGKYQELKTLDLHADRPQLTRYKAMLKLFKELKIKQAKAIHPKVLDKLRYC